MADNELVEANLNQVNEEFAGDLCEEKTHMDFKSLLIFPPSFLPRIWANNLVQSRPWKAFIIILIILNCILYACWDPLDPDAKETRNQTITYIDYIFLVLYTLEMALKIFVYGAVWHPKSYFRDPWNYLDTFVVIVGWIGVILSSVRGISSIRALRTLRPLRLISTAPQLRRIINAVFLSVPFLVGAFLLMAIFFIIYGVFGVILFNGSLRYHCVIDGEYNEDYCCNKSPSVFGGYECPEGTCRLTDDNIDFGNFNYDNVFHAWIAIFMIINVEGWSRWAYITMDATSDWAALYYVALVIIGAIFWLNLLLAVISVSLSHMSAEEDDEKASKVPNILQKAWSRFANWMKRTKTPNIIYRVCNYIVTHLVFETILIIVIIINLIVLAMPFHRQPDSYTLTLAIIDVCCLIFFTVEMFLRLTAKGIWAYFSNILNCLDCIVVITGWIEVIVTIVAGADTSSISVLRVLRALRLLRVLKLARKWDGLRHVIASIIMVIPTMFYFMILFGVVIITFMLIGIQLFGGQMNFDGTVPRYHFDSLYWSFITLFVVTTGEQWPNIIFSGMRVNYWGGLIYFVIWKSLSTYILLNLFISLLIDSFESTRKKRIEDEKRSKKKPVNEEQEYTEEMIELTEILEKSEISDSDSKENEDSSTKEETEPPHIPLRSPHGWEESGVWDRFLANPFSKHRKTAPVVFGCLPAKYPPRKQIIAIVKSSWFSWLSVFFVLLSCIALVIFDPTYEQSSTIGWIVFSWNIAFAVIFTIEMVMRMISFGVIIPKESYFRNGWDCVDFFIVIIAWLSIGLSFIPNDSSIKSLFLALRGIRAVRLLSRFEGPRVVVRVLIETLQVIPHIFVISMFFWTCFAIAGLQLFVGQYYYCNIDGTFTSFVDDFDECMDRGLEWDHWPSYFANIGQALLTIIRAASVNFPDPMIHGVDVAGEDENPIRDNHPEYAIFWVIFYVVCSWFILGLFIGSIVETFNGIRERRKFAGSVFLTDKQREWVQLQRVLFTLRPKRNPIPASNNFFRLVIFDVVHSRVFEGMILVVILVGISIQCTLHFQQAWTWLLLQDISNIVITIIFTIEAILKFIALGIRGYFSHNWNKFDFFVVVVSWIDVIATPFDLPTAFLSVVQLLRVARLFRFARVIKFSRRVQVLIKSTILSVVTLFNITMVLLVFFFVYVIVGVFLFHDVPQSEDINAPINRISNWKDFLHGCLMCFRLLTGEAWDLVQAEVMETHFVFGILYFISYIFIANLILMNLVVAILYENLGLLVSCNFNGEANQADIENFMSVWRKYDPYGTKFIKEEDLGQFLMTLQPPLGIGKVSEAVLERIIEELDIPVTQNNSVYFPDVLLALGERVYEVDSSQFMAQSIMTGWRKSFPENHEVIKGRRRLPVWGDDDF